MLILPREQLQTTMNTSMMLMATTPPGHATLTWKKHLINTAPTLNLPAASVGIFSSEVGRPHAALVNPKKASLVLSRAPSPTAPIHLPVEEGFTGTTVLIITTRLGIVARWLCKRPKETHFAQCHKSTVAATMTWDMALFTPIPRTTIPPIAITHLTTTLKGPKAQPLGSSHLIATSKRPRALSTLYSLLLA